MNPTCPVNYTLNKNKCMCEKIPSPKKASPKPKKTKKIILKKPSPKKPSPKKPSPKKPSPKKPSPKPNKGKYCNNRNPQIDDQGFCPDDKPYYDNLNDCCYKTEQGDWHKKNNVKRVIKTRKMKEKSPEKKVSLKKTIKIKNTTPKPDIKLSEDLNKTITVSPPRVAALKSFSPNVQPLLEKPKIKMEKHNIMSNVLTPIIDNISHLIEGKTPGSNVGYDEADALMTKMYNEPKITLKNGKVVKYNSKDAINQLLTNLYENKKIDCSKVIAPIQWQSNCWFNSGFMINYVSDRGRKFSQYLREAMITGVIKLGPGQSKKMPPRLHKIFFIFNLCIEASLSGNKMAYFMDTNFIIRRIYEAIPKKQASIAKTDMPSNPTEYYTKIINYLRGDVNTYSLYIDYPEVHRPLRYYDYWYNLAHKTELPDVIILSIYDDWRPELNELKDTSNKFAGPSGLVNNKLLKVELKNNNAKNTAVYELDSVLIRDTSARHFCCVLNCGGKEYGFDGESFHRMSSFKWKNLINKDKDWSFEGSTVNWNFRNGFQQLYYYRVQ